MGVGVGLRAGVGVGNETIETVGSAVSKPPWAR